MSLRSLVLPGLLATASMSTPAPSDQAIPRCTSDHPTIGRLRIERPGIRIERAGTAPVTIARAGQLDLCIDDSLATATGVATIVIDGAETIMARGRRYTLRRHQQDIPVFAFLGGEFSANWRSEVSASRFTTSAAQGGIRALRFRVDGLDQSRAEIVEGRRALQMTFTVRPDRVYLVDASGKHHPGKLAPASRYGAPRAIFPPLDFTPGERWTIVAEGGPNPLEGHFAVIEGPLIFPLLQGVDEEDRIIVSALALAGTDPERWSFEALQRILSQQSRRFAAYDAETILAGWRIDPSTIPRRR